MRVRALQLGYGGKAGDHAIREPGDVFEIDDKVAEFSLKRGNTWFEPVETPKATKGKQDDALA